MKGRPENLPADVEARPVVLEVEGLTHFFGNLRAVHDFDLTLRHGELVGLIGPNGAGKTTVFNLITGVYVPSEGSIRFQGIDLVGLPSHEIIQMGIARTFQNIRLFSNLTVLDNVRIAYHPHAGYSLLDSVLHTRRFREKETEMTVRAQEFLEIFGLAERQNEIAGGLPYGLQRRLEIARALAAQPRLLILDEPAAGMNPQEIDELMELIRFIRERFDLTVLLVEHRMRLVMNVCEWITVMDFGEVIARGRPSEVRSNPLVIEAYLGRQAGVQVVGVQ
ncbi:MAG TPA: ABC transporter ATP-binding protein [Chloroflexi bacterium]|nr:ABC transporter ATP-binding protein [Chloroflexota bacterium]